MVICSETFLISLLKECNKYLMRSGSKVVIKGTKRSLPILERVVDEVANSIYMSSKGNERVWLKFEKGLTYKEISEKEGVSYSSSRNSIQHFISRVAISLRDIVLARRTVLAYFPNISSMSHTILKDNGIVEIEDLQLLSDVDIKELKGIGKGSSFYKEIIYFRDKARLL